MNPFIALSLVMALPIIATIIMALNCRRLAKALKNDRTILTYHQMYGVNCFSNHIRPSKIYELYLIDEVGTVTSISDHGRRGYKKFAKYITKWRNLSRIRLTHTQMYQIKNIIAHQENKGDSFNEN